MVMTTENLKKILAEKNISAHFRAVSRNLCGYISEYTENELYEIVNSYITENNL